MQRRRGAHELLLALVLGGPGATAALVACGARTPLFVVEDPPAQDSGVAETFVRPPPVDSTVPVDTSPPPMDTSQDDVLPPIDVTPVPDVFVNDCPDAGATLIYVVTETNSLLSFYPPTAAFTFIGQLDCPAMNGATPFSMAVDKQGTAFVVFSDGELFQVSTRTAACVPTPYMQGQLGVTTFGMGFVGNSTGTGDTLFVAPDGTSVGELGTIDTTSFTLSVIGQFGPETVNEAELTGTGDGRLFAFYAATDPTTGATTSAVAQIDPTNATVLANNNLNNLPQGSGWAFAFWGGSFYLFTDPSGGGGGGPPGGGSQVTQFNPADLSQTTVATMGDIIVGAGVSTCAPMQ
jgi:hypothetical protein